MNRMHEITGTERAAEGILLRVETGSGEREIVFTFRELIDMQVNALHLLQFPQKYLCDPETGSIVRKQRKGSGTEKLTAMEPAGPVSQA